MASKRPSYTTQEQKAAWQRRNYQKYMVNMRYDTDQDLIEYIEANKDSIGTTQIIREALQIYVKAKSSGNSTDEDKLEDAKYGRR